MVACSAKPFVKYWPEFADFPTAEAVVSSCVPLVNACIAWSDSPIKPLGIEPLLQDWNWVENVCCCWSCCCCVVKLEDWRVFSCWNWWLQEVWLEVWLDWKDCSELEKDWLETCVDPWLESRLDPWLDTWLDSCSRECWCCFCSYTFATTLMIWWINWKENNRWEPSAPRSDKPNL